jgi:hypothetical protein
MALSKRLQDLLKFCNEVREAAGVEQVDVLDALFPAVPQDKNTCIVALNLNFNCMVYNYDLYNVPWEEQPWGMFIEDAEIRDRIAEKLGLEIMQDEGYQDRIGIVLPDWVGRIAFDFDCDWDDINSCYTWEEAEERIERSEFKDLISEESIEALRQLKVHVW